MKFRKRFAIWAGCFLILLAAVACGGGAGPAGGRSDSTGGGTDSTGGGGGSVEESEDSQSSLAGRKLRVIVEASPNATDTVIYHALKILEEEHGVEVSLINTTGGSTGVQALLAGEGDVVFNAPEDIINGGLIGFAPDRPITTYVMMGAKHIESIQDLEGRVYGVSDYNGADAIAARAVMRANGVNPDTIEWTAVGGSSERPLALIAGRMDATTVYGEGYLRLEREGFPRLAIVGDYHHILDDAAAATPEWLAENADLALAITQAVADSHEWFYNNKDEWVEEALEYVEGLDRDLAEETYDMLFDLDIYNREVDEEALETTMEYLVEGEAVSAKPLEEWFTLEYWRQVQR